MIPRKTYPSASCLALRMALLSLHRDYPRFFVCSMTATDIESTMHLRYPPACSYQGVELGKISNIEVSCTSGMLLAVFRLPTRTVYRTWTAIFADETVQNIALLVASQQLWYLKASPYADSASSARSVLYLRSYQATLTTCLTSSPTLLPVADCRYVIPSGALC